MPRPALVIFDCDGTLVDSQHGIVAAMTDAFAGERLAVPPREVILGVVGLSLDVAIAELLPAGFDARGAARLADAYKTSFSERRRRREVAEPLFPGVREAVVTLAGRPDVVLGIATGKSRRGVDAVLEREGFTDHFATVQTADSHPSKPHPSMVLACMAETGAEAAGTVVVGDTTFDMEMARAAGAGAVGVAWGYHPAAALAAAGADRIVAKGNDLLRELSPWLGSVEAPT